jgi:glycosyltransferase involved in cell wall biosynthesis
MPRSLITVPCFNEASRLEEQGFAEILAAGIELLFVNDGSTDATGEILDAFAQRDGFHVLHLDRNVGKAEAVRQGMLASIDKADLVGYIDADLATPPEEVTRLVEMAHAGSDGVLIGARIAFRGTDIERKPSRHYLGRVFATVASLALAESIYDTQCGAKFFKVNDSLHEALADKFSSRWAFDVELLGRLLARGEAVQEVPLKRWVHIPGSKLKPLGMVKAGLDLFRIGWRLRRDRG